MLRPREVVVPSKEIVDRLPEIARLQLPVTTADAWTFEPEAARRALLDQLRVLGLDGFGLEGRPAAIQAAGGLTAYLRDTQKVDLAHVRAITYKTTSDRLIIDPITLKHLEVVAGSEGGTKGSLLDEIDRTMTSMGGRLLRSWLLRPLATLEPIRDRLDAVEELAFRSTERAKFRDTLKAVHDLERLVARAALGTAGPRDLVALRQSLAAIPRLKLMIEALQAPLVRSLTAALDELADLRDEIDRTLIDEPPAFARDGGFTRDGVDSELDDLRAISRSGRQVIAEMEERERTRTGIASLKVRFNRVFGYYIEISKSNLHAVPADYHRKQTIAGGERFITPALKEYEEKVLGADERILARELEIFEALRLRVAGGIDADPGVGASALSPRRPRRSGRDRGGLELHQAARPRWRRVPGHRRPPSRRRTLCHRCVRSQRHRPERDRSAARDPDRAEYGRQVDVSSAGGAHSAAGADRVVRSGEGREGADRRSNLRARRGVGQHRARAIHLHGGDAGDRQHPAYGFVPEPGRARRDRPRHVHLRRVEHRVGRGGVPRVKPEGTTEDALRDALPRAHRSRRRASGRRERPRRGARVEGRHRLPAKDRQRAVRSQLRDPGREARGPSCRRCGSCQGDSESASNATSCPAVAGRRCRAQRAIRRQTSSACLPAPQTHLVPTGMRSRPG